MTTEPAPPDGPAAPELKTVSDAARALKISDRQCARLVALGMPRNADGSFDPVAISKWRAEQRERRASPEKATEAVALAPASRAELLHWSTEWKKHRAHAAEIEVKKLRGEVFTRELVEKLFRSRMQALARGLTALPQHLAQELAVIGTDRDAVVQIATRELNLLREAYCRGDYLALLEAWRRQAEHGLAIGRGRGRPRGS